MNSRTNELIKVNGEVVGEVDNFTYLGFKVSTSGDGEENIQVPGFQRQASPLLCFGVLGDSRSSRRLRSDSSKAIFPEQVPAKDSPYILATHSLKLRVA